MTGLADLPPRVQAKIRVDDSGCWIWTAAVASNGYGSGRFPGLATRHAHRGVYTLLRGPIPADKVCDHLCRVRACVNPDHVEVVTQRVNVQRGSLATLLGKTHCVQGHELSGDNLRVRRRSAGEVRRDCRACVRIASRARKLQAAA